MVGIPSIHESPFSTPEGRRIRDEVRELVPLIRENASAGEELGCLPPELLDALHRTGLFRVSVPPDFGGYALGARDLAEIGAAVATGDGSAAWMTMIASGFARVMLTFPDGAVREVYSRSLEWPGPVVASASLFSERIQQASRVRGGYLIPSGNKWGFGSGCKHAAYVVVGIEVPAGPDSVVRAMALLEKGQYEIVDDWHVMGLRGSSSNSVRTTEEIFVPEQRVADLARMPERLDQLHEHHQGLGYQLDGRGLMTRRPSSGPLSRQLCIYLAARCEPLDQSARALGGLMIEMAELAARKADPDDAALLEAAYDRLREPAQAAPISTVQPIERLQNRLAHNALLSLFVDGIKAYLSWSMRDELYAPSWVIDLYARSTENVLRAISRGDTGEAERLQAVKLEMLAECRHMLLTSGHGLPDADL
jgi:hypothetical protein